MRSLNLFLIFIKFWVCSVSAHESDLISPMVDAVNAYLASLDESQLKQAQYPFESRQRGDWHYVPKGRKGLAWGEMTSEQKHLSKQVFVIAFSDSGHTKAKGVVAGEQILWEQSGHHEMRNPKKYYVTIFGAPSLTNSWGISVEGHHLSINITVIDGHEIFVTPSFMGANPNRHEEGPFKGSRPLAGEADQALKLVAMFDAEQLSQAKLSDELPREIITGADRKVEALAQTGLSARNMTAEQREQLHTLIFEYVGRYRKPIALDDMQKIEASGFGEIYFTWAGSTKADQPMYYRVQGPTFLLEYVNIQNKANHAHAVWRDFENDFGYDALRVHVEEAH